MDRFCSLMACCLLRNFSTNIGCDQCNSFNSNPKDLLPNSNDNQNQKPSKTSCNFTDASLPLGCVLERILSIQKLNEDGFNRYCDLFEQISHVEDWKYVDVFLKEIDSDKCPKCFLKSRTNGTENNGIVDEYALIPYLLAAVGNDCSFMVTFRRIEGYVKFTATIS